ncbi:MAG TPA: phosphatase PAP2 family protein [Terriglobales bacterium]|nr:phosphatase PAP2 family protein [Terriglobales bacterium]
MRSHEFPIPKLAAVLLLSVTALFFGTSRYFLIVSSLTAFPWIALLGCTLILLRFRFQWIDFLCALAFVLLCLAFRWRILYLPHLQKILCALLGVGSLLVLAARAIWSENKDRTAYLSAFIPAFMLVGSEWLTPPLLHWGEANHPRTLDLFLLIFDSTLGFQPSFWMGRLFEGIPLLRSISLVFYFGLPLLIALVFVEHLRGNRTRALVAFLIFFFAAILGAASYSLYPACGPISLLGVNFPHTDLPFSKASHLPLEPVPIPGPRNAMPSMHMAWAILAWWLSRDLRRWVNLVCIAFLVFTVSATLGTGEHYFIDLIVAFPFSLCMYGLFSLDVAFRERTRVRALVGGALGLFLWLALLRYEIPVFVRFRGLSWGLIVLTVVLVAHAQCALRHARKLAPAQGRPDL